MHLRLWPAVVQPERRQTWQLRQVGPPLLVVSFPLYWELQRSPWQICLDPWPWRHTADRHHNTVEAMQSCIALL